MNAEEALNAVMDAIETRVLDAVNAALLVTFPDGSVQITSDFIYEDQESFENVGTAIFVSGNVPAMQPLGNCADTAQLEVGIGFRIPDKADVPKRVQRMAVTFAIRKALTGGAGSGTAIFGATMAMVTDMAVTAFEKPRDGWVVGGLAYRCQVQLPRG